MPTVVDAVNAGGSIARVNGTYVLLPRALMKWCCSHFSGSVLSPALPAISASTAAIRALISALCATSPLSFLFLPLSCADGRADPGKEQRNGGQER